MPLIFQTICLDYMQFCWDVVPYFVDFIWLIFVYLYANNLWPTGNFHFELLVKNFSLTSLLCLVFQETWYRVFLMDFNILICLLHLSIHSIEFTSVVTVAWVLKVANTRRLPWSFMTWDSIFESEAVFFSSLLNKSSL